MGDEGYNARSLVLSAPRGTRASLLLTSPPKSHTLSNKSYLLNTLQYLSERVQCSEVWN